jgi:multidrug efflux system outer membrane protein
MTTRTSNAGQTFSRGKMRGIDRCLFAVELSTMLILSGCAVGPNYVRPKANVPADFRGAEGAAQQASYADLPWWEIFKDDQLKSLIDTALANNYDLAVAVSRVEQARQLVAVARSQFLPAVN